MNDTSHDMKPASDRGLQAFGRWLFEYTKPVRSLYTVFMILGAVATVVSITYFDYFDHRKWATDRIAESYKVVEKQQGVVVQLAVKTLPSLKTGDKIPAEKEKSELYSALISLSTYVASVDNGSDEIAGVAQRYRQSISNFLAALVRLNTNNPETYSELLFSADEWDKAAKRYADVVEDRINSYASTLMPAI